MERNGEKFLNVRFWRRAQWIDATHAYQLEAMINVLERKGILTNKEVLDELEVIVAIRERKD